jgi:hypothetical protein
MDSGDDPAIATSSAEPLVAFVPGEDMIAVHKRAMKAREEGRSGNQLVPSAPKQFNAADYLLPIKAAPEPEPQVATSAAAASPSACRGRSYGPFDGNAQIQCESRSWSCLIPAATTPT